jgi:hypothetical protein
MEFAAAVNANHRWIHHLEKFRSARLAISSIVRILMTAATFHECDFNTAARLHMHIRMDKLALCRYL